MQHFFLQSIERPVHLLLLVRHLLRGLRIILPLAETAPQTLLKILLLRSQLLSFLGHICHFRTALLVAHSLHGLLRLLQTVSRLLSL